MKGHAESIGEDDIEIEKGFGAAQIVTRKRIVVRGRPSAEGCVDGRGACPREPVRVVVGLLFQYDG